jgi:hypothetical protein
MTTTELVQRRDYLVAHRRMIVGRSLAATIAGAVPVPFVDDWLVGAILGSAYRKIANGNHVDVDDHAIKNLVHGRTSPASWSEIVASGIAFRLATRMWKRVLLAVTTVRRARAAARQFVVMTLFEHYCARLHVGFGLDGVAALQVRDAIAEAIDTTPGTLSFEPFRRGARAAARASLKAPLELADVASGGRLRRLLERGRDVAEPVEMTDLDRAIDEALADKTSFLGRAAAAVELQLSAEVNPYLDAAITRFDEIWKRNADRSR